MYWGVNRDRPALPVKQKDLERVNATTPYRSICPCCGTGWLMMQRNQKTLRLEEKDQCTHCLQAYEYLDIQELRRMEER